MEPHREEQKPEEPRREEKPKRFRLIKLEERIAPSHKGGGGGGATNGKNATCATNGVLTGCCGTGVLSIE
jgi:hypothetical protein